MITVIINDGNRQGKFALLPSRTVKEIAEALHIKAKSLFIRNGKSFELLEDYQTLEEFGCGNLEIVGL